MRIDCAKLPVMKGYCKTCPFKPDENGIMRDVEQANAAKVHLISITPYTNGWDLPTSYKNEYLHLHLQEIPHARKHQYAILLCQGYCRKRTGC
jgi:hypothetical protein